MHIFYNIETIILFLLAEMIIFLNLQYYDPIVKVASTAGKKSERYLQISFNFHQLHNLDDLTSDLIYNFHLHKSYRSDCDPG